jgi:hypothetical protein
LHQQNFNKPKNVMKIKQITTHSLVALMLVGGTGATMTSCKKKGCTNPDATNYDPKAKKDDGSCTLPPVVETEVNVSGLITSNTTWTSDKIWILNGKVVVTNGATLTIQPGTIVKGAEGQESLASALVIARGAKINAVGTAAQPIIFTSILDNIKIGEKVGTNLTRTDNEKWGGVAILGYAPTSAQSGDTETRLEGLPADEDWSLYGGSNASDDSGDMAYVSIRHGGISIGEGNELNGLTLGGVGSGTSINNVEIYATLDDGIECFGGTVNITNALVYFQGDDGIDLDMNYSGTIENFIVIHGDGIGTDKGLEIDGPEGSTYTTGKFILKNGLVKSVGTTDGQPADFKDKAQGTVENVTFDYSSIGANKAIRIRAKYNSTCDAPSADAFTRLMSDDLKFINCTNPVSSGDAFTVYTATTGCTVPAADQTSAMTKWTTGTGGSVSISTFSWTCAGLRSQL